MSYCLLHPLISCFNDVVLLLEEGWNLHHGEGVHRNVPSWAHNLQAASLWRFNGCNIVQPYFVQLHCLLGGGVFIHIILFCLDDGTLFEWLNIANTKVPSQAQRHCPHRSVVGIAKESMSFVDACQLRKLSLGANDSHANTF